jgi:hypothetical protein
MDYVSAEAVTAELAIADSLDAEIGGNVFAVAATGEYFRTSHDGESFARAACCVDREHDAGFGDPGGSFVYFLVRHEGAWFVDWKAEVRDGMVDTAGTRIGGETSDSPLPLDWLRVNPLVYLDPQFDRDPAPRYP